MTEVDDLQHARVLDERRVGAMRSLDPMLRRERRRPLRRPGPDRDDPLRRVAQRPRHELLGDPAGSQHPPAKARLTGRPEHPGVLQIVDLGHRPSRYRSIGFSRKGLCPAL